MLTILNQAIPVYSHLRAIIEIAAKAAMLRRYCQFIGPLKTDYLRSNVLDLIDQNHALEKSLKCFLKWGKKRQRCELFDLGGERDSESNFKVITGGNYV